MQHFWSLSAEEQFYLVWPVLILAAWRRRAVALALVTLASFAYGVADTAAHPAAAYFVTPTRAWEFGAGGLLALAGTSRIARPAVCWAGLAAVAAAAAAFTAGTPFPGVAALVPVLGAVAVIWAAAPVRVLALRPVQGLGDVSYGVYLWHWPLLILAPYAVSGGVPRGLLVVLTLLLAAATKRWVEDPVRRGRVLLSRPPRWTLAPALAATALVIGLTAFGSVQVRHDIAVAQRASQVVLEHRPRCFGAAGHVPGHPCVNRALRLTVVPTPAEARDRGNLACGLSEFSGALHLCGFGVAPRGPGRPWRWWATATPRTGAPRWTSWPAAAAGRGSRWPTPPARCPPPSPRRCPGPTGRTARPGTGRCGPGSPPTPPCTR